MEAENTGAVHLRREALALGARSMKELFLTYHNAFDVFGEQSLFALDLFVLDLLTVLEGAEAFTVDAGVVDEHVFPLGIDDESESLLRVEPLDGSRAHERPPAMRCLIVRCDMFPTTTS